MIRRHAALAAVVLFAWNGAAQAESPGTRDPDWPCQQIKVPTMSVAAMWSGPLPEATAADWRANPVVASLVEQLSERRIPLEQAEARIRAFAGRQGARPDTLMPLLVGLFEVMNRQRDNVLAGLDRFGRRQKALADELRRGGEVVRAAPDGAAAEQARQQLEWQVRVFEERRQALVYVCDVPGRIEQRLYALVRTIREALDETGSSSDSNARTGKTP